VVLSVNTGEKGEGEVKKEGKKPMIPLYHQAAKDSTP